MMDFSALSAEFPRDVVHWRAQALTRDGKKALALAYLDARDVMDRLDEVCGPNNWQSEITETAKGRVICRLGVRVNDEWVWKSDGAGDTAVEGEKGGISDALKRAAVHWGIGRYLYRLDAVWAPCETYEKNGKAYWKSWDGSPWDSVRGRKAPPEKPKEQPRDPRKIADALLKAVKSVKDSKDLENTIAGGTKFDAAWEWLRENDPPKAGEVNVAVNDARERLGGPIIHGDQQVAAE